MLRYADFPTSLPPKKNHAFDSSVRRNVGIGLAVGIGVGSVTTFIYLRQGVPFYEIHAVAFKP